MDKENVLQSNLKEIMQFCRTVIDELHENPIVAVLRKQNKRFEEALDMLERIIPATESGTEQDPEAEDVSIRSATVFIIALWSKLRHGIKIDDLTKDDWINIMSFAREKAMMDPKEYSLLVFDLYRKSIAFAIEPMREDASADVLARLEEIVALMESSSQNYKSGDMFEVKYIEENLWLSLEAVFLVMADRLSHKFLPKERQELAEAISALVFQQFRYSVYDRELAAINECLEHQAKLDQKLTKRVNAYIDALSKELDEFDAMVEKAFDTKDFQAAFRGSVVLARSLGAKEMLETQQDVDDYFMS